MVAPPPKPQPPGAFMAAPPMMPPQPGFYFNPSANFVHPAMRVVPEKEKKPDTYEDAMKLFA